MTTELVLEQTGLSLLNDREASLMQLAKEYKGLTIDGVDDKEGYKKVSEARKILKSERVKVEKDAKELRENAVKFQKSVISREKELVAIIEPIENELQTEETRIDEDREKIRVEDERKKSEKINSRIKVLSDYHYAVDIQIITNMSDEKFQDVLNEAKTEFNKSEKLRIEEEQRQSELKRQNEERQDELRKQEEIRLEDQRKLLEQQRLQNEAKEKELEAERDKIKLEQEARQKEMNEHNRRIQEEQEAKDKELRERQLILDNQEKERIERIGIEAEAKAKKERDRQEEIARKKREKEEAEEKLKFGEDSDRFSSLSKSFDDFVSNAKELQLMQSAQGQKAASDIESLVYQAMVICKTNSKEIENCK